MVAVQLELHIGSGETTTWIDEFVVIRVYSDSYSVNIFSVQTFVYLNASGLLFSSRTELIIRNTLLGANSLVLVRSDAAEDPIDRLTASLLKISDLLPSSSLSKNKILENRKFQNLLLEKKADYVKITSLLLYFKYVSFI